MRDLIVFGLFVTLLPMCLLRPWVGVCAFSFLAYNRTQDLTWGFARSLPISQAVAMAMIVGWLMFEYRPLLRRDPRIKAMVVLVVLVGISMFANTLRWEWQGHRYQELIKIMFVAILTSALCVDRRRLRQILLVVAFGLGFYGAKNGLMYFLMGSKTIVGPGGMLKDNNDFALAMVMNLPFLWYLSYDVDDLRYGTAIKWAMRLVFALTFITIIATGSRGAFLATGAAVGWMILKTRWKIPAGFAALILALIAWQAAPQEYKDRISTMFRSPDKLDQSAKGRLVSWAVAFNMIKANPGLGIGFNNMVWEYHMYTEGVEIPIGYDVSRARVAHNSYLQIWAESGTFAYLTFMYILLSTIVFMFFKARRYRKDDDSGWAVHYCMAIETTLIAFLIGATFLNRAHFDLVYQIAAVAAAIPAVVAYEKSRLPAKRWGRRAGPARITTGLAHPAWSGGRPPVIGAGPR